MPEIRKIADYRGFEIAFREGHNYMDFLVQGEDFTPEEKYGSPVYASFEAAKKAIDKHITAEGKVAAAQIDVAIECYTEAGDLVTFRGLNRASGKAKIGNGTPYAGALYPKVRWVGEAARRLTALREEAKVLAEKLLPLKVTVGQVYDRQIAAERYAGRIKRIKEELAAAESEALDLGIAGDKGEVT